MFRHLVIEHQHGIADAQRRVHNPSVGHFGHVQHLRPECFFVKLKSLGGIADNEMWGQGVKSGGDSLDFFSIEVSSADDSSLPNIKMCQKILVIPSGRTKTLSSIPARWASSSSNCSGSSMGSWES